MVFLGAEETTRTAGVRRRIMDDPLLLLRFAARGLRQAVDNLLSAHPGRVNQRSCNNGQTALMFAAAQADVALIHILLSHGANANILDDSHKRAIDLAANEEVYGLLRPHTSLVSLLYQDE